MNYEQFILAMQECIKNRLSDAEAVEQQKILKNNGVTAVGLSVRKKGENAAPIIYLEDYYRRYCMGDTVEGLSEELLDCIRGTTPAPEWKYEDILDFSKIRHQIVYKLVNAEKNRKLLEKVPNLPMLDFAIIFYVMIPMEGFDCCSVLIRNSHMDYWKLPISLLYQCAKENTRRLYPPVIRPLSDFLEKYLMEEVPKTPLLLLSNEAGLNGASAILYPDMPKTIYECVGRNYYILPSSIHELLIVPENEQVYARNLKEIVRDVNENHIAPEEYLSDSVYYFDGNIITEI